MARDCVCSPAADVLRFSSLAVRVAIILTRLTVERWMARALRCDASVTSYNIAALFAVDAGLVVDLFRRLGLTNRNLNAFSFQHEGLPLEGTHTTECPGTWFRCRGQCGQVAIGPEISLRWGAQASSGILSLRWEV